MKVAYVPRGLYKFIINISGFHSTVSRQRKIKSAYHTVFNTAARQSFSGNTLYDSAAY